MKRNLLSVFVMTMVFAFVGFSVQASEIIPKKGSPVPVQRGDKVVEAAKSETNHVFIENFEGASTLEFQVFANGSWDIPEALEVIDNPDQNEANPSARVLQFTRAANGDPWAGFFADLDEPLDFSEWGYVHFQVWKPIASRVLFKVEGSTIGATPVEIPAMEPQEEVNEWVYLVFDCSDLEGGWERVVFFLDFPETVTHEDDVVMYMDNIIWSASPEPVEIPEGGQEDGLFMLSFDVASTANTAAYREEHYSVWISTTGTDAEDFTMLWEETLDPDIPNWDYQYRELDISAYAGEEVYVAFRHHESTDMERIMINNVKITFTHGEKAVELIVFHEDFNGGIDHEDGVDWLPDGWLAVDADEDGHNWYFNEFEGDGYMLSRSVISIDGEWVPLTPDNWLVTPAIALEGPEVYTVTFVVEDEDGVAIEDAVITLGTTVNAAGAYVFDGIPAGTYAYSVVAEGYADVEAAALEVEGDLTVTVVMEVEDVPAGFEVTFNVNMAGAVAWQDLVFDPEIHRVWITGSFADWAQPGTNPDFEMHPAKSSKDDVEILYPGNWANRTGEALYVWGDGEGYVFGTNVYEDTGYGQIFRIDQEYTIVGGYFWIGERLGSGGEAVFTVWDYSGNSVGSPLATKTVPLAEIESSEDFDEAFYVEFDEPLTVTGDFLMGVDISGLNAFQDGLYGLGNMSSNNGDGANAGLALVREGTAWVAVTQYQVNVDAAIFPVVVAEQEPLEPLIYTLTTNIEEGEYEYKYFLVVNGATWDHGEWPGDPNRDLIVEGPMVVNDVFGEQPGDPTNVDEPLVEGFAVYPNPVRDVLNIQAVANIDAIRVFDLSGRIVHQAPVNDTQVQLNVNPFARGMYILQVISGNDVQTHRFQVYK